MFSSVRRLVAMILLFIGLMFLLPGGIMLMNRDKLPISRDPAVVLLLTIFSAVGAALVLPAVILIALDIHARRRDEMLVAMGQREWVQITRVEQVMNVTINGQHPWRAYAECTHPITYEPVTLKSKLLQKNIPQVGDTVEAVFDQYKEKRYVLLLQEG
ncbi:MAG: hypothetical protein Q4C54_08285 [Clostridia bacterium]|nr:hypothetical protein [Clostridia bacterium]